MRVAYVLLSLLLLAPAAAACGGSGGQAVAPLLGLDFPTKKLCKDIEHLDCDQAPKPGESLTFQGTLTWQWDVDNCEVANPQVSMDTIVVSFPPFPRNPGWLAIAVEPAQIDITFADQWDIQDDKTDPATGKVTVYEEWDLTVTITNTGVPPTQDELDRLLDRNGVVEEYLKAVSSETPGFQPGFQFENFRLDASWQVEEQAAGSDAGSNDTPAPAFGFVAVALAGLAVLLRRRA